MSNEAVAEYEMVLEADGKALSKKVSAFLEDGWELYGDPVAGSNCVGQAVVLTERQYSLNLHQEAISNEGRKNMQMRGIEIGAVIQDLEMGKVLKKEIHATVTKIDRQFGRFVCDNSEYPGNYPHALYASEREVKWGIPDVPRAICQC